MYVTSITFSFLFENVPSKMNVPLLVPKKRLALVKVARHSYFQHYSFYNEADEDKEEMDKKGTRCTYHHSLYVF